MPEWIYNTIISLLYQPDPKKSNLNFLCIYFLCVPLTIRFWNHNINIFRCSRVPLSQSDDILLNKHPYYFTPFLSKLQISAFIQEWR